MGVDELGTGQRLLQREEIEHPHALALDADRAPWRSCGRARPAAMKASM